MAGVTTLSILLGTLASPAFAQSNPIPTPNAALFSTATPTNVYIEFFQTTHTQEYQLISGPNTPGAILRHTSPAGSNQAVINLTNLVPNSAYVVQIRNKTSTGASAWFQYAFKTPVDYPTPIAPQNLRVTQSTTTSVTVVWDLDTSMAFLPAYVYSVNGGPRVGTGVACFPYCAGSELATATITRPVPGTAINFSVTSTSVYGKTSAPSVLVIPN